MRLIIISMQRRVFSLYETDYKSRFSVWKHLLSLGSMNSAHIPRLSDFLDSVSLVKKTGDNYKQAPDVTLDSVQG